MFCMNCGTEVGDNVKFCPKCGAPLMSENGGETKTEYIEPNSQEVAQASLNQEAYQAVKMPAVAPAVLKEKTGGGVLKALLITLLSLISVGLIGTVAFLFGPSIADKLSGSSIEGNYKKAEELLDAGKYEDAIGYYQKVIDKDPSYVDAYIGAANAYVELDSMDEAIDILADGYVRTKDKSIYKLLEKCLEAEGKTVDDIDLTKARLKGKGKDEGEPTDPEEGDSEGVPTDASSDDGEVYEGERTQVTIDVRQVDASDFPNVVLYASVTDPSGETVTDLKKSDFLITEIDENGNVSDAVIDDVYQVIAKNERVNTNLILDASGSMNGSKMTQAKSAANSLLNRINFAKGDQVEIISFDDYVYLQQAFTSDKAALVRAIDNIYTGDMTALYDAIYSGLYQTYYEDGAKCVIAFTDGAENASSYSFDDVVELAQNTGIPVYIIGIGDEGYDHSALQDLAACCSGTYYSINDSDIQSILEDIYISIYEAQQDYYVLKYTASNLENLDLFRDVVVSTSDSAAITGVFTKSYVPEADVTGAFSSEYMNKDFIFEDSSYRELTYSDLEGLSLAELRIARNEIFARHGRQFKDQFLNQWFYSKTWYLNIPNKYSPEYYDKNRPDPLSKLESQNVSFIKQYEDYIVAHEEIYPNARMVLLTEYDLALSKATLRIALEQLEKYSYTDTLEENKRLIREAIEREEVQY